MPRTYPIRFGWHTVGLMPVLTSKGEGQPPITEQDQLVDGPEIFASMDEDLDSEFWKDARFGSILIYLRGNQHLELPQRWRAVFPTHF